MLTSFRNRFLLIWLLGICLYFPLMNGVNAWFDEEYSLYISSLPWSDMLGHIMKEDAHPPFHYILLKLWNMGRDFHGVGWVRFLSLVLLAGTALLGAFPVRRLCGDKIALFYTAFVFLFPRALFLGTDMRMYGLLNLEITAMVIYALLALKNGQAGDWIKFLVASLFAMYTHYFGVLTLAVLDTFLFFAIIQSKQNIKRQMYFLFGCAGVSALAFLPWFACIFLNQANNMYSDWYPDLGSLEFTYTSFIKPIFERLPIPILIFVAYFSALMWLLMIRAVFIRTQQNRKLIACVLIVFFGVLMVATLFSLTIRPMMSWRYLTPYGGLLAFALAMIMVQKIPFRNVFFILLGGTFCIMYVSRFKTVQDPFYTLFPEAMREMYSPQENVFLCGKMGPAMIMSFYLPEYRHYYVPKERELVVAPELLNPLAEMPADFKDKNIVIFWRYEPKYDSICPLALDNRYDHFATWCIGEITPEYAEEIIKERAVFLPEPR